MKRPAVLAPLAAGALVLTACGSSGTTGDTTQSHDTVSHSSTAAPKPPPQEKLQTLLLDSEDLAPYTNSAWRSSNESSSDDDTKIGCTALDELTNGDLDKAPNAHQTLKNNRDMPFSQLVAFVPHANQTIEQLDEAIETCDSITLDGDKLPASTVPSTGAGDGSTGLKAGQNGMHVTMLFVASGNYLSVMILPDIGNTQNFYTTLDKAAVKKINSPS